MASIKQGSLKVLSYVIVQPFNLPFNIDLSITKMEQYKAEIKVTIGWTLTNQQTITDLQIKFT